MTMQIEPPPPGEGGRELTGELAVRAVTTALQQRWPAAPPVRITPRDLEVRVEGPWVAIAWTFTERRSFTIRISKHWAYMLKRKLNEALGS